MEDPHTRLNQSCQFIQNEGLIRLAHMIQEMRTLPEEFLGEQHIKRVYNWYLESYRDILEAEQITPESVGFYFQSKLTHNT